MQEFEERPYNTMYHHIVDGLVKPNGRSDREINPPWADNDRGAPLSGLAGGQYTSVAKRTTFVGVRIGTYRPIGQPLEGEDLAISVAKGWRWTVHDAKRKSCTCRAVILFPSCK